MKRNLIYYGLESVATKTVKRGRGVFEEKDKKVKNITKVFGIYDSYERIKIYNPSKKDFDNIITFSSKNKNFIFPFYFETSPVSEKYIKSLLDLEGKEFIKNYYLPNFVKSSKTIAEVDMNAMIYKIGEENEAEYNINADWDKKNILVKPNCDFNINTPIDKNIFVISPKNVKLLNFDKNLTILFQGTNTVKASSIDAPLCEVNLMRCGKQPPKGNNGDCIIDTISCKSLIFDSNVGNTINIGYLELTEGIAISSVNTLYIKRLDISKATKDVYIGLLNGASYNFVSNKIIIEEVIGDISKLKQNSGFRGRNLIEINGNNTELENYFAMKNVCVTGTLDWCSRDEAKRYIEQHHGNFQTSITKDTNYLITEDSGGKISSKVKAALTKGIPIIDGNNTFKRLSM